MQVIFWRPVIILFSEAEVIPSINFSGEDLSQYVVMQLDLEASSKGYKETVCHRSFCCEFYVKTESGK